MQFDLKKYPGAYCFPGCLGILDKEKVLVLTDKNACRDSIQLIAKACSEFSKNVECDDGLPLRLEEDFPGEFQEKIKRSDVIILAASQSWYQAETRRKAKYEFGKRIIEAYGLNPKMFEAGALCADYDLVSRFTERISLYFKNAKKINLRSQRGTNLTASIKNCSFETGIYKTFGSGGNLPAGEISLGLEEGSAKGVIVVDLSIDILGALRGENLTILVEDGCIINIEGQGSQVFKKLFNEESNAKNVIEIGIGTNTYAILGRSVLEDEKKYGTAHIGFGNNTYFGGRITGPHYDCVILKPAIELDDKQIFLDNNE